MLEIKYRDPDGEECEFLTPKLWLHSDVAATAAEIAEDDRSHSSGLYDTDCWPRIYEILFKGEWVSVSVEMEYTPHF